MAPKKSVRVVEPSEMKSLAEAGALPPSENSDDGIVEREVDVMSEPPEIDTTRAEERPPDKRGRLCLLCLCIPLVAILIVLTITSAAYASSHSNCTATEVLHRLNNLSVSEFEAGASRVYEACVKA